MARFEATGNSEDRLNITVYPNPAKNNLIIHNFSETAVLKLYELNGRLVKQQLIPGNTRVQIHTGDLKNGLYLINMRNEKGVMTKKVVIEK